jgi:hypothetical protein
MDKQILEKQYQENLKVWREKMSIKIYAEIKELERRLESIQTEVPSAYELGR